MSDTSNNVSSIINVLSNLSTSPTQSLKSAIVPLLTPPVTPPILIKRPNSDTILSSFPPEILLKIFGHLRIPLVEESYEDILNVSLVCRRWHNCSVTILWNKVDIRRQSKWFMIRNYIPKYGHLINSISLYWVGLDHKDKQMLLKHCRCIKILSLVKCRNLDKDFLCGLVKLNQETLRSFMIWGPGVYESLATEITDDLLLPMLNYCKKLKELKIQAAAITDKLLINLANSTSNHKNNIWPELNVIDLSECGKITAGGIAELFNPSVFPKLFNLRLQYHEENDLDVDFFDFLAKSFPQLKFYLVVIDWYLETNPFNGTRYVKVSDDLQALCKRRHNIVLETLISGRQW
ncbi:7078_t:CDS:1 [Funneliformis caledonium]|uniref:7078_t:CDS:1 n=1 Tax=Funneliformis caledonium TaxID=1117310 RepID=A0A9N8YYS0_9GLOM|nr:7078_t:CDS:1 [Funneliformis caledonium]